jgi:hypothetical protein
LTHSTRHDAWQVADSHGVVHAPVEPPHVPLFTDWLDLPPGLDWMEVGCGTAAPTVAVLDRCAPAHLLATEPSEGFRAQARSSIRDPGAYPKNGIIFGISSDAPSIA